MELLTSTYQKNNEGKVMTKQKKGNKEAKKPKAVADGAKKQKKDPKRHDGIM
jgi:hypothetical protein